MRRHGQAHDAIGTMIVGILIGFSLGVLVLAAALVFVGYVVDDGKDND